MNKLKNMKKNTRNSLFNYALIIVLFVIFQSMVSAGSLSRAMKGQLVPLCVYITSAIALNLVVGFAGDLSLGHAGFMSIGAFAGVVFYHLFGGVQNEILRLILCMVCGGITAGIFGFLIGTPVLRLNGDYLAIVTLAFGEIIKNILNCVYLGYDEEGWHFSFSKALEMDDGTVVLNGPMGVTGNDRVSTFFVGFLLVMFTLIIVQNLMDSRYGRAITAVRDNRIAAESVGLSGTKFRMTAFVISAVLTGMAGALYVMNYASIAPGKFNFNTSILFLCFVVMGGMGSITGSIIAAIVLTVLPEKLRAVGDYRMLIYAVLLIVVMLTTQSSGGRYLIEKITSPFAKLFSKKQETKEVTGNG